MAVKVVNSRYPGFIFDGENSRDYGVYITDVEVFGAPKRKVEMISIPGRNGDYALDEGSFENIPVKYKCVLGAGTEEDFNNGISDFRNWLASKVGYRILSDEINLGEYRKGVFLEGMEVPTLNKQTGTFEVVFDCMPQRWLDDASSLPVEMASGGDIFNPTLHEASPLLTVDGYGDLFLNDDKIHIMQGALVGKIPVPYTRKTDIGIVQVGQLLSAGLDAKSPLTNIANTGDSMTIAAQKFVLALRSTVGEITSFEIETIEGGGGVLDYYAPGATFSGEYLFLNLFINSGGYTVGTAGSNSTTVDVVYNMDAGGTHYYDIFRVNFYRGYYEQNGVDKYKANITYPYSGNENSNFTVGSDTAVQSAIVDQPTWVVDSSKSAIGDLYIDLEIGECYQISNGEYTPINSAVSMPAELPTLKAGHNTVTFDNTIDKLVISPRWWKV